jgi:ribosomal protein S18 acetylase RimI-like enzyme
MLRRGLDGILTSGEAPGCGRTRHAPASELAFRPLAERDLVQLFQWIGRPHVDRDYARAPASFAEFAARYRPRVEEDSAVKAYILESGGEAVGYIQAYPVAAFPQYARTLAMEEGAWGVDLFLGDEWRLHRGLGSRAIADFVARELFAARGALICVAGPAESNRAAIRAFEKAGFHRWRVVANERGERECILRRDRDAPALRIDRIDLADAQACVRFRRDMYVASFGTEAGLEEEMGEGDALYLEQLRAKIAQFPEGNVHLRRDGIIAGQLEMRLLEDEPRVGYVSLFYVVPEARGAGLGRILHEHAACASRGRGHRALRLSVSVANVGAIRFYRALGWEIVGSRPNKAPMALMEFALE